MLKQEKKIYQPCRLAEEKAGAGSRQSHSVQTFQGFLSENQKESGLEIILHETIGFLSSSSFFLKNNIPRPFFYTRLWLCDTVNANINSSLIKELLVNWEETMFSVCSGVL